MNNLPSNPLVDEIDKHILEKYLWKKTENGWAHSTRNTTIYLHREILGITGDRRFMVEFINGDRFDCQRTNIRAIPMGVFTRNHQREVKGYSYREGRNNPWEATISHKGRKFFLGSYCDESSACEAYQRAVYRIQQGLEP
jgi:hypothetical protein